jgi:hypothetical protein
MIGGFGEAVKAICHDEVAILRLGDFAIVVDERLTDHSDGTVGAIEGFVEAVGEHSVLEARGADEGLPCEGDAFDGEELFGVDGLLAGDEVFAEAGDLVEFFDADDGEDVGGEAVFPGILGGAGFAFGGARSGGAGGVGAIGGEALGGRRFFSWVLLI